MACLPVFLLSCFLLVLWLFTVLFKLITNKMNDYYKHETGTEVSMKMSHILIIILVVAISFFITIKFFYDNIYFSIIVLLLLSIVSVLFVIFFYHNHYLTIGKIINEKVLKYKKIRLISSIFLSLAIISLCVVSYIFSFILIQNTWYGSL